MFPAVMSNSTHFSLESIISSNPSRVQDFGNNNFNQMLQKPISNHQKQPQTTKKKRNLPGNPDPDAEVIAISPKTLLATNRFVCEICKKGFQRDQNLQLHRRGHNLPWKLKQTKNKENNNKKKKKKRVYVCPEPSCVHHNPSRALGDLTGIKKHYCRKHGEKKWKCEKCSKIYAVRSDWKAHSKICGTREYRCDCGTIFSRKGSFITHRAFCDALAEESGRLSIATHSILPPNSIINSTSKYNNINHQLPVMNFNNPQNNSLPPPSFLPLFSSHHRRFPANPWGPPTHNPNPNSYSQNQVHIKQEEPQIPLSSPLYQERGLMMVSPALVSRRGMADPPLLSATALLEKAATLGSNVGAGQLSVNNAAVWRKTDDDGFTRDFLGADAGDQCGGGDGNLRSELLSYAGGVEFAPFYGRDHLLLKHKRLGYAETWSETWSNC